jgi:SIR2-like domain
MPTPLEELERELSTHSDRAIVIAGAGVSCATVANSVRSCASWIGLLRHGIQWCVDHCPARPSGWQKAVEDQIALGRADDLITAAGMIKRELNAVHEGEYGRWLHTSLGTLEVQDPRVIKAILTLTRRIATTNCDNLIEAVGGRRPVSWTQPAQVHQALLGDTDAIVHVHGHYFEADSVVLDARSYAEICGDEQIQGMLRSLFIFNTAIFVGCGAGLDDPNFGTLFVFIREALRKSVHRHFHLARSSECAALAKQYEGLPVTIVDYGGQYEDLAPFLERLVEKIVPQRTDALQELRTFEVNYDEQINALEAQRDTMPPLDFVRQTFELCRALWNVGGRHTAADTMREAWQWVSAKLTASDMMVTGLEAAERLLDDDRAMSARFILQEMARRLQDVAVPPDLRAKFARLQTQCLSAEGRIEKALQVMTEAMATADPTDKLRYAAERAELQLLRGDLTAALDNTSGGRV